MKLMAPNQTFDAPKPRARADSDAMTLNQRQSLAAEERKGGGKNRSVQDHDSKERQSRRQRADDKPRLLTQEQLLEDKRQNFDSFIQHVEQQLKLAEGDPERQFQVLKGNITKLASKKVGSIMLQEYVERADKRVIEQIIDQLDGKLADLMIGKYGNFFCSKLIDCLTPTQRVHFLKQLQCEKFVEISCDERGTWVLQNILCAASEKTEF